MAKDSEFVRGVKAAADVMAQGFDSSSTHAYRLEDVILCKLNVVGRKPRRNATRLRNPADALICGVVLGVTQMQSALLGGLDDKAVRAAMRASGITLAVAKAAGCSTFDMKVLRKAGVR